MVLRLKLKLAKKIIKSKSKVDDPSIPTDIDSLFSILMDLPDKDLEFLEKIKSNVNFLPTTSNDRNRYNSLCNHGVFSLADNGSFLLTDLGKALIEEIDREF
nr:hypothetical protein [uncultured Desulfobacter sp.]